MNRTPWVEKYRPKKIGQIVGNEETTDRLKKLIHEKEMSHVILSGSPGTGKTSSLTSLAKELFTQNYQQDVLELNASSDRKADDMKYKVKSFVMKRKTNSSPFKLVIMDESDSMTEQAQQILAELMESGIQKYETRFALACNDLGCISQNVQNMCTVIRFQSLQPKQIIQHLRYISAMEEMNCSECLYGAIVDICHGDMRLAINYLQTSNHLSTIGVPITAVDLYQVVHKPHPRIVILCVNACKDGMLDTAMDMCLGLHTNGYAVSDILETMAQSIMKIDNFETPKRKQKFYDIVVKYMNRCVNGTSSKLQLSAMIIELYLM